MSYNLDLDLDITNVRFQDDPIFVNMDETLRGLSYIYFKYYSVWNKLKNRYNELQYNVSSGKNDAGYIYNKSIVLGTDFDLPADTYKIILNGFKLYMSSTKMKNYVSTDIDEESYAWSLCHYFFVPVRLIRGTIPKQTRFFMLKRWLTTCMTLPRVNPYTNKFKDVIGRFEEMQQKTKTLDELPNKIQQIENTISKTFIDNTITKKRIATVNDSMLILRVSMNVFVLASVEILRKFCPNYEECSKVNPDYNGAWIDPLDSLCSSQITALNGLCDFMT